MVTLRRPILLRTVPPLADPFLLPRSSVFPALLAAILGLHGLQTESTPREVVRVATLAVEGDSVEAVRTRWETLAASPASSRPALLGLAILAQLNYEPARADSLFTRLLPTPDARPDAVAAMARLRIALAARGRGSLPESERLLAQARTDALAAGDTALETEALIHLAMSRARTAGPASAEPLFAEAASRLSTVHLQAFYHCGYAEVLVLSSRPAGEEALLGASLAAQDGDRRLEAACRSSVASDRARRGDSEGAIREMQQVVTLRRQLRDLAGLANALQWKGFMLRTLGWLEESRRDLDEAVAAARASNNVAAMAWSYSNLAYISLALGDAASGAVHADSAATLFASQGDLYGQGSTLSVQAEVALEGGDLDAASTSYRAALDILEPLGFGVGIVTNHIGLAHIAMARQEWAEAGLELEAAASAARTLRMPGRLQGLAYHRAVLALRRGDLDGAETELLPALRRVEAVWTKDPAAGQPDWAYHYRMRLAEIQALRGDLDGAEALALEALDALEAWRATLSRPQIRVLAFQASEDLTDPDLGFATVVSRLAGSGRLASAFALAERLRGRELEDQLARIEALGGADTAASRTSRPRVTELAAVSAAVPDDRTALLHFVTGRGGEATTLFVVGRFPPRALVLPPADSLEKSVRRFDSMLASGTWSEPLAALLGESLLGAAAAGLPASVDRLVVIPDGPLHLVSWDALILPGGAPLLERFGVAVDLSSSLTVSDWTAPTTDSRIPSVLAFGNPSLTAGPDGADLPPLRAAAAEARRAARYGVGSVAFVGPRASEARLKAVAERPYSVLHLATHARVDEGTLAGTSLLLSPGEGEDGVLGAGDIARIRLSADLVILSSCSSATGPVVRGEGVVGMASAFREAGARSVVLTRWPVGDRVTADLVDAVYREMAAGRPLIDAVRAAKLSMMRAHATPDVWASLTVVGDPTLEVPLRPPVPFALYASGAVLVLVLSALGLGRIRRARAA